jgi:TPR repeat protein
MAFDLSTEAPVAEQTPDLFQRGLSHATGIGADLDYVEAHKWFNIAALRGDDEARARRQEMAGIMTAAQVAAAQRAAREWLAKAAN